MNSSGNHVSLRFAFVLLAACVFVQSVEIGFGQNQARAHGMVDFLEAIRRRDDAVAAAMLESNTNLALGSATFRAPALLTAAEAGNVSITKRLLALGAEVDAVGDTLMSAGTQRTALDVSIANNQPDICRVLLEAGAYPNKMAFGYETPLHLAFKLGREEMASLLLDYGAEPFQGKLYTNDETTPFELAITASSGKLVPRMLGQDRQNPLGSKSLQKPRQSKQPRRGLKTSDEILLRRGNQLLTAAAQRGELEAVLALVRAGVSVREANTNCPTLLQSFALSAAEATRALPATLDQWQQARARLAEDRLSQANSNYVASLRLQEAGLAAKVEALNPERRQMILEFLIKEGAIYDAFAATALGDTNQARLLAAANEAVSRARDCHGQTPLHWAVQTDSQQMAAFWIARGVPLGASNSSGHTALHLAAAAGKVDFVKALLAAQSPTDIRDANGWTALDAAIQAKHPAVIRLLMSEKSSPPRADRGLATMLHEAAASGNVAAVAALLESETNLESRNELGLTPLHVAVQNGHLAAAALLVDKGADMNARDPEGNTLLLLTITRCFNIRVNDRPPAKWLDRMKNVALRETCRKYLAIGRNEQGLHPLMQGVSFLVACGVDVSATNKTGVSAAQLAANEDIPLDEDREPLLKLLQASGGNLSEADSEGNTPLHRLAHGSFSSGALETISSVLASGANVNATNRQGRTPLHETIQPDYIWRDRMTMLIDAGANVNAPDMNGYTPLHLLALSKADYGEGEAMRSLLAAGANPNAKDTNGCTPAHLLLLKPWPWTATGDGIAALAKAGANLSSRDNAGKTPLHYLAALGNQSPLFFIGGIDKTFADANVDFGARDDYGDTALHIAAKTGTRDVFDWLVKQGASMDGPNRLGETARLIVARAVDSPMASRAANPETDIFEAARQGNAGAANRLLNADPHLVNRTNRFQQTPLRVAVMQRQTHMVSFLEARGAIWDAGSAVMAGRADVLNTILQRDPAAVTTKVLGQGLAHIAAINGDTNTAKLLINANCDLLAGDNWGLSPLGYALIRHRREMQALLLQHGARENIFDAVYANDVSTASDLLEKDRTLGSSSSIGGFSVVEIAAATGHTNILRLLLNSGATVTTGRDPVQLAAFCNQGGSLALLIHAGARIDKPGVYGFAPLHWAALGDATEAARLLLSQKADVNQAVAQVEPGGNQVMWPDRAVLVGSTPLHVAALRGATNMVQLLLRSGANPNTVNASQLTPLDLAGSLPPTFLTMGMSQRSVTGVLVPLDLNPVPNQRAALNMDIKRAAAEMIKAAGGRHANDHPEAEVPE